MAEETRGVFTLKTVRNNILNDEFVTPEQAFVSDITAPPNVGYYCGGGTPSPPAVTVVDRCTFSTDTTARIPSGNLATTRSATAMAGNLQNGYLMGGINPSLGAGQDLSVVSKFNYTTETDSTLTAAFTSTLTYYGSAAGNINFGYLVGGAPSQQSKVDKMIYAVDGIFRIPSANLTTASGNMGAVSNTTDGYFCGGNTPGVTSTMNKIDFSTDTVEVVPGAALSSVRAGARGAGDDSAGYFGGGINPALGAGSDLSVMDKLTYSNDTTAQVPGAKLTTVRYNVGASGNRDAGYYGGGSPGTQDKMDKCTYSSDTTAQIPGASLSLSRGAVGSSGPRSNTLPTTGYVASTQNLKGVPLSNAGYYQGGYTPFSYTQKIDYSTDTNGRLSGANNTQGTIDSHSGTSSNTAGYFGLGSAPGGVSTIVNKLTYLTEAMVAVPGASFPTPGRYDAASVTSYTNGYFGGGFSPGPTIHSKIEKLNYATETSSSMPGAKLATGRYHLGSAGNLTQGYFVQGITPSDYSNIDKLTYATDTAYTAISAATNIRSYIAGTSTESAGYFGGGSGNTGTVSFISKLSFSVDTWSQTPANLNTARYNVSSVGNSKTSGYFMGGWQYVTTTERISYASETVAAIPSGSLVSGTNNGATASLLDYGRPYTKTVTPTLSSSIPGSASNAGYFGGGALSPGTTDAIDKVDFSTDVTSTIPGTLSISRYATGASSSPTAGYFAGGNPGPVSTMDKLTYSSETAAAVPAAKLSYGRYYVNGMGNSEKGFWGGGYNDGGGTRSTTDKCTYSSDTTAVVPGAALYAARYGVGGISNSNYGYFGGGSKPGPTRYSSTDRIVFSTDTASILPSANLTDSKGYMGAAGNPAKAYFIGGTLIPASTTQAEKLTYSTETYSLVTSANAPGPQRGSFLSATGNDGTGYFGAGLLLPASTAGSSVFKVNYSTETSLSSPSSFFPTGRWGRSATSARENSISATSNIV